MRFFLSFGLASTAGVVGLLAWSCGSTDVTCEDLANCAKPPAEDASTDESAASGSDSAEVGTHEAEAGCTSTSPPSDGGCLNEAIAIFVSPKGNDSASGKRGSELRTIGAALRASKTGPKRIYVCDDGTGYAESLVIDAASDAGSADAATANAATDGISLYGAFDCATWSYDTTKRAKVTSPSGPALVLRGLVAGVTLADFELTSPNATAMGTSSIAAIVDTSMHVVFERVKIAAGSGADGQPGIDGAKGDDGAAPSVPQQGAAAACPAGTTQLFGGAWTMLSACGSRGGNGGPSVMGAAGYQGVAGGPPGLDNAGPAGMDGRAGANGAPGMSGVASTVVGLFSSTGYKAAPPGGDGADGIVGQGGGGGGASNATGTSCIGASGGAGGMGGCGGKKGLGGDSGGASVALLSWSSDVMLDNCELASANGGAGGKGGNGGLGGLGKAGAEGGPAFISDAGDNILKGGHGGLGGNGGLGGSGAGGNGGPSYGLVYKGDSPSKIMIVYTHGMGGVAGVGGSQVGGVKGADGIVGDTRNELQVN
jgi:hypothetical protein